MERLQRKHDILYASTVDAVHDDDCTFTPAIANKSRLICKKLDRQPLFKRYKDEIVARKSSLEKIKETIKIENEEKLIREEKTSVATKLKNLKRFSNLKKSGSLSIDKKGDQEGISVNKLDLYSRNIAWNQKKQLKLLEKQHEKQAEELNKSIELRKQIVGSNIKPSVSYFNKKTQSGQFLARQATFESKKNIKKETQLKEEKDRYGYKSAFSDKSKLILKKKQSRENSRDSSKISADPENEHNDYINFDTSKIIDFETDGSYNESSLRHKLAENLKKIQKMEHEYQRTSKLKKVSKAINTTDSKVSSRLYQPVKQKRQEVRFNGSGSIAVLVDRYRNTSKSPSKNYDSSYGSFQIDRSAHMSVNAYFSNAHKTNF